MFALLRGDLRSLIRFVRVASIQVENLPITSAAVGAAVAEKAATFATAIPEQGWKILKALDAQPGKQLDVRDPVVQQLMEQLAILEYVNGDDLTGPFMSTVPWYAVHPVVQELSYFKDARLADLERPDD